MSTSITYSMHLNRLDFDTASFVAFGVIKFDMRREDWENIGRPAIITPEIQGAQ
jgi:hypothetical protein